MFRTRLTAELCCAAHAHHVPRATTTIAVQAGYDRAQWVGAGRYAKCVNNTIEQVNDDTETIRVQLATPRTRHHHVCGRHHRQAALERRLSG
ncbi:MAG: hypothetical protein ACLS6O_07320 [Bifidobacterium sp.]